MRSDSSPEDPRTEELPPNPFGVWLKGALASNLGGLAVLAMMRVVASDGGLNRLGDIGQWTQGTLVASTFLVLPFAIGFGAAFFWREARRSGTARFGWTLANFAVSLGGAAVVLREGALCLVMAAPLLLLLMWIGCAVGFEFWKRHSPLKASVVPLLVLWCLGDAATPHDFHGAVTTQFRSTQPPAKLWRFVASYPRNEASPEFWLWRLGLPYPVQARGEPRLGGRRDCAFSGGVSIGERVVHVVANRKLEFVVDEQPNHPEVVNHFRLERGRIELWPDGRGGTILRGTSWYALKVYPTPYFCLWTRSIIHHVHERVFAQMERCALLSPR